jgi:DNA/RNA endonuclease YhcR with UshA esterase domain
VLFLEDDQIFKIALLTSLMGLVGMMITAGYITPQKVLIKDLDPGMMDKEVSLEGMVQGVGKSKKGDTYFLDFTDGTGRITIVVFESTFFDMEKNNVSIMGINQKRVNVTGYVAEYRGNLELILKDSKSLKILA